jgi:hypothetical protein
MKLLRPLLAGLAFLALGIFFTNYFAYTLALFHLNGNSELALFISSPFNISTEGQPLYSLYLPAVLIFVVGAYLKNFNKAFQRKCRLRAIFIFGVLASYMKSVGSMLYYVGYANYGISLGTSVMTLSFIAAFAISLEVYVERKERFEHLYSPFMFTVISGLILLLAALTLVSFFTTSSLLVHAMGLSAFLLLFVPYYERHNIARFVRKEEHEIVVEEHHLAREEHKLVKEEEHKLGKH